MTKITSETTFEEHIEAVLLTTHGYFSAKQEDYDKALGKRGQGGNCDYFALFAEFSGSMPPRFPRHF